MTTPPIPLDHVNQPVADQQLDLIRRIRSLEIDSAYITWLEENGYPPGYSWDRAQKCWWNLTTQQPTTLRVALAELFGRPAP